jgi:ubiquinone/menaquinone biosynthesis C-methylase UbiE
MEMRSMGEPPATIDNDWARLYREFPEIYDEFTSYPYQPGLLQQVRERFDLAGKTVLDVGAGGGQSAIPLARSAGQVIGVEPEAAMRSVATRMAAEQGVQNVTFLEGHAGALPLDAGAVDVVVAITAPLDVAEALRVVRSPGLVLHVDVTPGWYGGELSAIIQQPTPELDAISARLTGHYGFAFEDVESVQEYGTSENILRTYGFIFGPRAIAHLQESGETAIRWRFRIHYRRT